MLVEDYGEDTPIFNRKLCFAEKDLNCPELVQPFKDFINRVGGKHSYDQVRCTSDRVDKDLELNVVKAFSEQPNSVIECPPLSDDFKGIDVIANGYKIQVKCYKTANLVLEDCKYRNGRRYPGKVDVCQADFWLKCNLNSNNTIHAELYKVEDLKEFLELLRKNPNVNTLGGYNISVGGHGDTYEGDRFFRIF